MKISFWALSKGYQIFDSNQLPIHENAYMESPWKVYDLEVASCFERLLGRHAV